MLELATPNKTRPTLREAANLLCHGARTRLGRPASRSVVALAVLAAVVCGLFSAAVSARIAWETADPLPTRAEAAAISAELIPVEDQTSGVYRDKDLFVIYGEPVSLDLAMEMFPFDGGEYQQGSTSFYAQSSTPIDRQRIVDQASRYLRGAGWAVHGTANVGLCNGVPCGSSATTTLLGADREDVVLQLEVTDFDSANAAGSGGDRVYLTASLYRATPSMVYVAAVVGGLLGAIVGWLLFGWASRRTEHRHPFLRSLTVVLYLLSTFLWYLPIVWSTSEFTQSLVRREFLGHWPQLWEWLGQPVGAVFFVTGLAVALLGLAVAALPHSDAENRRLTPA